MGQSKKEKAMMIRLSKMKPADRKTHETQHLLAETSGKMGMKKNVDFVMHKGKVVRVEGDMKNHGSK